MQMSGKLQESLQIKKQGSSQEQAEKQYGDGTSLTTCHPKEMPIV